jgi:hypothetical protein
MKNLVLPAPTPVSHFLSEFTFNFSTFAGPIAREGALAGHILHASSLHS